MIIYDTQYDNAILVLRKTLIAHNFDLLVRELKLPYVYFEEPSFIYHGHSIDKLLKKLTKPAELLIRLFGLIQEIDHQDMRTHLFSDEQIDNLISLGLLIEQEGKISTDQYGIIPFLGTYLIATMGSARSIGAYISRHSYILATNLLNSRYESFLDMGSGCGILAILAARKAKRVVGIDILSEAVEVGKTNVVLNNVKDRVNFYCGDMYQPVLGQQFDLIVSQPPFAAIPDKYEYAVSVSGGEDGLKFSRQLLHGMFAHNPQKVHILGNSMGNAQEPILVGTLRSLNLSANGYKAKLLIYGKHMLDEQFNDKAIKLVQNIAKDRGELIPKAEILSELKATYQHLGVSYYYGIVLEIEKATKGQELEIIDISNKYNLEMVLNFRASVSLSSQPNWSLQVKALQLPKDQTIDSIKSQKLPEKKTTSEYMQMYENAYRMFGLE